MANTTETTSSTVIGYFETHAEAENAVTALKQAGFLPNQVGIVARAPQQDTSAAGTAREKVSDKAEGVWSKVKNFFEGGDVEPYADEAQKGDLASHEITAASNAPGSYPYSQEDFRDSLQGLSVPEEHSRYFGSRFGQGEQGAVVTVTAPGRHEEAADILQEYGADLGDKAANYEYPPAATGSEQQHVQLFGEVLRVHKDRINRGEVRIRKEVITETQTIQVPVTREELVVERIPVSGEKAATGAVFGEEREIRIPLTEERASVDKQAVVREEVRVGKRDVSNVESVNEQVRHEELVVEDETKLNNRP